MRILDRYIGRQVLTTALFAIAVLSLVLVLGNVFKQLLDLLVNHDVPLEYILSFIAYIIPFSLTYTIPWGFLTAVLLVFGRLSAENELIALRANGVSVPRVCVAVFFLALVCVGVCFWINVDVAPKAQDKMKAALYHIATSNPIAMFGSDQIIDEFPGRLIYVEKKDGTSLEDILMFELNDHGQLTSVVHARKGELQADVQGKQQILLRLNQARYEEHDAQRPDDFMKIRQGITMDKIDLPISLQELYEKNQKRRGLSQMTLTELMKSRDAQQETARKMEVNKRFSFSLASLAFCLIAVPLGITTHRKETSVGFFISIVVALIYFLFIELVDMVRNNPHAHPEMLIWLPNVIFMSLGGCLFFKMSRK